MDEDAVVGFGSATDGFKSRTSVPTFHEHHQRNTIERRSACPFSQGLNAALQIQNPSRTTEALRMSEREAVPLYHSLTH